MCIVRLGTGDDNKTGEFSEKFQLAIAPPRFRKIILQLFSNFMLKIYNIKFWIENAPPTPRLPFGTLPKIHLFWYGHPSLNMSHQRSNTRVSTCISKFAFFQAVTFSSGTKPDIASLNCFFFFLFLRSTLLCLMSSSSTLSPSSSVMIHHNRGMILPPPPPLRH